jgi:proline dehydrogenase
MGLARNLLLWGSRNQWLESQVRRRAFVRRAVRRFMPGEELDAALAAAAQLKGRGLGTVLTQLGEAITDRAEAGAVHDHYVQVLGRIRDGALPALISVKPTQLGLDLDPTACADAIADLAARAAPDRVFVDMEDSAYVDRTLALFRQVRQRRENVGLCLQAYLRRTPADLEALMALNPAIRMVKGAYAEPPDRAFPRKADVDAAYLTLTTRLIEHTASTGAPGPVLGTHDVGLIAECQRRATAAGLDRRACEVHMLYGIRSGEQERLRAEGYAVRVLISYGRAWFRWYMRRLAERPANVWFVVKSVIAR